MEFVGFRPSPNSIVRNLSSLDRKLLMIASAIATSPKLLLLDEPVGGLNPEETDRIMELVRKIIAGGVTIMLIEHVIFKLSHFPDYPIYARVAEAQISYSAGSGDQHSSHCGAIP